MAKTKTKRSKASELDSAYFLKLVMYLIVGAFWVRFGNTAGSLTVPLPVGLAVGLLFVRHEQFQIDRKIEYAILLLAMVIGFWAQIGILITL